MKFVANITPNLLLDLGINPDQQLCEEIEYIFGDHNLVVESEDVVVLIEGGKVFISLTPENFHGDLEIAKDILYEGLLTFFDPEFSSEVEVEIDNEL